ncbi:MAG: DNRLRE domain-containing protein [Xanthomonadales bacterium]|nr:DNRLRE domain-containing protein [Gammaproteobacteria bacterium]MBT8054627.1 DNRLRE domain-containing protein [Gammaproteobacteria bacterium]NND58129.1 DNRLRE domain-containing protein [Xanthomonadales bacterium]NNK50402.1 DNRLRE domain-containing protein [Xanthomonadales bacterium]
MRLFLILVCCLLAAPVSAETVVIDASQDNTLYESSQGALSNGAGDYLFAGRTLNQGLRRAVIAFKDLGEIPEGATIQSVRIHLWQSRENAAATTLSVHRLDSDWGEGTSNASGQEGAGAAATAGDATWNHRFFDNLTWNNPGGDFSATASAQITVDNNGAYMIESTQALVADVQGWLDDPNSNFGWILLADEGATSARRFNSRENPMQEQRPMLEVEYLSNDPGPAPGSDWSGPWFDPTLDGEGYLVFVTPAGWLIYYFGYSSDNQRLWLVSDIVTIDPVEFGTTYEFSMLVGAPGSYTEPTPSSELTSWGTLQVVLDGCTTGVFTLDGVDGVKVSNAQKIVGVDGNSCSTE